MNEITNQIKSGVTERILENNYGCKELIIYDV